MYSNTAVNQNNSPEKIKKILTEFVENEENEENNTEDVKNQIYIRIFNLIHFF